MSDCYADALRKMTAERDAALAEVARLRSAARHLLDVLAEHYCAEGRTEERTLAEGMLEDALRGA